MKGSESKMKDFMEGNDKRFIIPVYQRKYDWKYENCKQLYEDLKKSLQTIEKVISLGVLFRLLSQMEVKLNITSLMASKD